MTGGFVYEKKQKIFISRVGIFLLQLIAIAALLWTSENSLAEYEREVVVTPACKTETCKRTHSHYNTIPIPSAYLKNPPDTGRWYRPNNGGRDGISGQVWVPGLVDEMNDETKAAYYEVKSGPLGPGWNMVRKGVADALQLAQDFPSTTCHDNMQAAATGKVRMVCNYTEGGKQKSKTYTNLTTNTFNDYFDKQFVTVSEHHLDRVNQPGNSNSPYSQYYDSHGNLESTSRKGNVGFSQNANGTTTAYARYITNHVAPNYNNINRSTAAVFSQGNEKGLTLEQILKKKKAEYAPGIRADDGKAKTPQNTATANPESSNKNP